MTSGSSSPDGRRRLYLDSSAYLCVLLGETGAERVSTETDGAELLSSALLVLETKRTLVRLVRDGSLTADQYHACLERLDDDQRMFIFRDLTLDLCDRGPLPAVAVPRSLDLAHLRTALWFHLDRRLHRFVTLDTAQASAARELGLPV